MKVLVLKLKYIYFHSYEYRHSECRVVAMYGGNPCQRHLLIVSREGLPPVHPTNNSRSPWLDADDSTLSRSIENQVGRG